jgi:hypothetical protein
VEQAGETGFQIVAAHGQDALQAVDTCLDDARLAQNPLVVGEG